MKKISEILREQGLDVGAVTGLDPRNGKKKLRLNIIALGDVGTTMLIGLRLLGGDVLESIGICDLNEANLARLEMEMNQIRYPGPEEARTAKEIAEIIRKSEEHDESEDAAYPVLPPVRVIPQEQVCDCDVLVFCASRGVPAIGAKGDVRMAQLETNRTLVRQYGALAAEAEFSGLVAVVSDPVDPLAKVFVRSSGLDARQFRGYGLGVMNARASYYAERDDRFSAYLTDGRAFGPHGRDLVIANSIEHYDDGLSRELTDLTVNANQIVRRLGYKPYIAPALSSAALSILLTLRGQWHYSSLWFGNKDGDGAFLGIRNRLTDSGNEFEDLMVEDALYERIRGAYMHLRELE